MNLKYTIIGLAALGLIGCAESEKKSENSNTLELKSELDSVSYSIGINYSDLLKEQKVNGLNGNQFSKGFKDLLANERGNLQAESQALINSFMQKNQLILLDTTKTVKHTQGLLDSLSYAFGVGTSFAIKQNNTEGINSDLIGLAINDYNSNSTKINSEDAGMILKKFGEKEQAKAMTKQKEAGRINLEKGNEFLAENAKRDGVVTLESGLQYEIIKEGNGPIPTLNNKVSTHYHGTRIDGSVFDSSVERGQPAEFTPTQVIKGWTEALQLMPVGSKWKLFIPSNLAYGERGSRGGIEPNTTLIFDLELLSIVE